MPGTGFRIAPGLGLTAAHVGSEFFTKLALPEGMPIPRQQRRYEGLEVRAAEQEVSGETTGERHGWWYVNGFFNSKLTDICLLMLTPGNDAARAADERGGYLRWSLSPPSVEQRLYAFGYIKEELESETTDAHQLQVTYTGSAQRPIVTAVHPTAGENKPSMFPRFSALSSFDPATAPSFDVRERFLPR